MNLNGDLLQLWNCVLAIRGLSLHHGNVGILPVNHPPCAGSTGLKAGASVENDHDVLAERRGHFRLAYTQPFTGPNHQHNRDDSPSDAEHGEERAKLMSPKGPQYIANKIAQNHLQHWTGERGMCEPDWPS